MPFTLKHQLPFILLSELFPSSQLIAYLRQRLEDWKWRVCLLRRYRRIINVFLLDPYMTCSLLLYPPAPLSFPFLSPSVHTQRCECVERMKVWLCVSSERPSYWVSPSHGRGLLGVTSGVACSLSISMFIEASTNCQLLVNVRRWV